MSFLKAFWKGNSKHEKLCEEWALANSKELEGDPAEAASFSLKYLGSALVAAASSETATAEAIKTIISMAKAGGRKLARVNVSVSLRGIRVCDAASEEMLLDVSIYRISYCSADATYNHVFAFIATNSNETLECHAFLCPKRKIAQEVTLTVARSFNTAYEMWQMSQGSNKLQDEINRQLSQKSKISEFSNTRQEINNSKLQSENKSLLIDFSAEPTTLPDNGNSWVSFEEDSTENFSSENFNANFARFPDSSSQNTVNSSNSPKHHMQFLQNNSHNSSSNSCWGETHSVNLLCS